MRARERLRFRRTECAARNAPQRRKRMSKRIASEALYCFTTGENEGSGSCEASENVIELKVPELSRVPLPHNEAVTQH
jgi:hypothetical protein